MQIRRLMLSGLLLPLMEAAIGCEAYRTLETTGLCIHLKGVSSEGGILHRSWFINGEFVSDAHSATHIAADSSGTHIVCPVILGEEDAQIQPAMR